MIKLSRSKIELFLDCGRCFWLDLNNGVRRPPPAPYTINMSVDHLLKKEFDINREKATPHYLIAQNRIDAIPFKSDKINDWRNNFKGIRHQHNETDFLIYGALDDVWINPKKELIVVDYKATGAKEHRIYDSYKRQIEIYQWLLIKNGYKVSNTAYFIFARVNKEKGFGDGRLSFDLFVEPLEGDISWIEGAILEARKCLDGNCPPVNENCTYCNFSKKSSEL